MNYEKVGFHECLYVTSIYGHPYKHSITHYTSHNSSLTQNISTHSFSFSSIAPPPSSVTIIFSISSRLCMAQQTSSKALAPFRKMNPHTLLYTSIHEQDQSKILELYTQDELRPRRETKGGSVALCQLEFQFEKLIGR